MNELFGDIFNGAQFSPCRTWRYELHKIWGQGPCVSFIGLNPSTADETHDDPTIRRCLSFARDWGFSELRMLNIFAFRATDPKVMKDADDPIGKENDFWIKDTVGRSALTVCAWGIHGDFLDRGADVAKMIRKYNPVCLGTTKDGHPRHPLYLRKDVERVPFRGE